MTLNIFFPALATLIAAGMKYGGGSKARARGALAALPPSCQLGLLRDNVWLLKPSLNGGGNGRGIMLLGRLPLGCSPGSAGRDDVPALLLAWVAAVGRSGSGGQNDLKHGFVLQKAVERPHLLNRELLLRHWPTGHPLPSQPLPPATADDGPAEHFKYNWRAYVLASLAAPSPSAYLYDAGYVDLCPLAFTRALNPGAQVSNTVRQRSFCRCRLRVGFLNWSGLSLADAWRRGRRSRPLPAAVGRAGVRPVPDCC